MHTHTHVYTYIFIHTCVYICIERDIYICMYVYMYVCSMYVCMYVCMYTLIYIYIYIYIYTYIYTYIYIYIYIYCYSTIRDTTVGSKTPRYGGKNKDPTFARHPSGEHRVFDSSSPRVSESPNLQRSAGGKSPTARREDLRISDSP